MKKIAIIGGGIIGLTLANYLDSTKFEITLFDEGIGQATGASAGIISPWLSKRRNKKWYQLAKDGAAFFPKLIQDLKLDETIYSACGTLLLREQTGLLSLAELAETRKKEAPEIGDIQLLSAEQTQAYLSLLKPAPALYVSGGGRLDGRAYLAHATKQAEAHGVTIIREKATIQSGDTHWQVQSATQHLEADLIAVTAGPFVKPLLEKLAYQVDIRPQKGQLLAFDTPFKESHHWPVAMLDGEADLIPFMNGKILLGATHENDGGWDLTPTKEAFTQLVSGTHHFLENPELFSKQTPNYFVGTRAYTSDFAPFFGPLEETLVVASGLGSSGLTTGPYIGYLLANYFNETTWQTEHYQKPIETYIKKTC